MFFDLNEDNFNPEVVSIPFEQGDVFRRNTKEHKEKIKSVSIPFEQGDVFRHYFVEKATAFSGLSQSLSNRAMFFDVRLKNWQSS